MDVAKLDPAQIESFSAEEVIAAAVREFGRRFVVVSSLQPEDNVILDMAVRCDPKVRVMTLDTGRLHPETYEMIDTIRKRYGVQIEAVSPDAAELEAMVTLYGANLFYEAVAFRKLCCQIRKVNPLAKKMREFDAQAVGLRRTQSPERAGTPKVEFSGGKWKFSPLADWSAGQVEEYVARHDVPRHPLQDKGYPSIGCAPCTRAVKPGEDARAGRWWWETEGGKECGLHQTPSGQLQRELDVRLEEVALAAFAIRARG
jgi:phosphoadenosine phosphosulfate reductase